MAHNPAQLIDLICPNTPCRNLTRTAFSLFQSGFGMSDFRIRQLPERREPPLEMNP